MDQPTSPSITHVSILSLGKARSTNAKPLELLVSRITHPNSTSTPSPRWPKTDRPETWDARRLVEAYGEVEPHRQIALRPVLRVEWLHACMDSGRLVEQEPYRIR